MLAGGAVVLRLSHTLRFACSHSESETKRFHADHSAPDVVMLLIESGPSQSASVSRSPSAEGVFLVDVIGWDSASGDSLRTLGSDCTIVTCTQWRSHEGAHAK